MPSDVVDLRDFYRTGLGQVARRMIRRAIQRVWPDLHGMRLLGIGYTTPFLSALSGDTERTVALMPALLGVLRWPMITVVLCLAPVSIGLALLDRRGGRA